MTVQPETRKQTIIVGGGIAGITCALKLKEAGVRYLLISENIGGRICYKPEYAMNFGAVFYMQGYRNTREILVPGKPVLPSYFDLGCHSQLDQVYGVISGPILGAAPQLLKILGYLKNTFKPHYESFKKNCETMEMREAMEADSYISDLFRKSATDFISELGFEKAAKALVSQFVYACTGTAIKTLNALDYCNCAMGLIDTAMRFTFDSALMQEQLASDGGEVEIATVSSVNKSADGWGVVTNSGNRYEADSLVLATPAYITKELLEEVHPLGEIRNASKLYAHKVKGKLKPAYARHKLHLFDEGLPLINIGVREDGAYEVFTCEKLDMGLFFEEYEIIYEKDWDQALYTNPSLVLDQCLGDSLYMCGDHNALGLEPAAVSGLFVANKIIETEKA
jgi:hypothetical protein